MNYNSTHKIPRQRLPYKSKGKKWRIENIDAGDTLSFYNNDETRQSLKNRIINLNLYNGIVNVQDMLRVVNPHNIEADFIPDNIPHIPIIAPKINLLVGEEIKRRFDWKVTVTNKDAISRKEEELKKLLTSKIEGFIKSNYSDEELKQKLAELQSFVAYSWQDSFEKMSTMLLKHYWEEENFKDKFANGFKHALILGEEIYQIEILHGEPKLTLLNPLKVYTVQSGNSNRIEDAQLIVIEDHWSKGKIIDVFHDVLKPKDIDDLSEENSASNKKKSYTDDQNNHLFLRDGISDTMDDWLNFAEVNGHKFSKAFQDSNGNIRVLRVYWKSLKKIQKIKYYDKYGDIQYKLMSEEYKAKEDLGEESTVLWVNEWWEGTKIGKDLYVKMQPLQIQYNRLENPSICHPGIIGQIYNTNQGKAVSLVDRVKNLQYMYDAITDRLNKAIAKNHGKILELDIAKVPKNWEIEKWLHFAYTNGIAVVNSFEAGTEGVATGKLAGNMNSVGGRVLDLETGGYIQQHINLLAYLKEEIGELTGVSAQRQGQIENRETIGGIERAVTQSSHITEYWFHTHENVKIRVLSAFLEAAKEALRGNSKKVQYLLDDYSIQVLNIDGTKFASNDYGIIVSNTTNNMEVEQMLKKASDFYLQNGGSLKTVLDIWMSPSLADKRRKLEIAEANKQQADSEQAKEANKIQKENIEFEKDLKLAQLELERYKIDKDSETKIEIANKKQNTDNDKNIVDADKNKIKKQADKQELLIRMKELDNDIKKHKETLTAKTTK